MQANLISFIFIMIICISLYHPTGITGTSQHYMADWILKTLNLFIKNSPIYPLSQFQIINVNHSPTLIGSARFITGFPRTYTGPVMAKGIILLFLGEYR